MKEIKQNIFKAENDNDAYASYVIRGEKTALIGGAADSVGDDIIKTADYAVFTNTIPALGINRILKLNPKITIAASVAGIRNLKEITNSDFNEYTAKDNSELDLGGTSLKFMITPHLFSPDTILVYDTASRALFSGLLFGLEEVDLSRFKPYAKTAAQRALELKPELICPALGEIITNCKEAIGKCISQNTETQAQTKSAAIFYVSHSGNTEAMTQVIEKTLLDSKINVNSFNMAECDKTEAINAFYSADILIFGTPTIHRSAAKPIWDMVTAADLVNMKRKPCMVFGSYGWGGEGTDLIYNFLKLVKLAPFEKPFKCAFTPSEADIAELIKYTKKFTETIQ